MDFTTYQQKSRETAIYKNELKVLYPALGLAGEAGEVCEKIKKIYRDKDGDMSSDDRLAIRKELGDVLWYICLLYTSPSPRDKRQSRMPSSA